MSERQSEYQMQLAGSAPIAEHAPAVAWLFDIDGVLTDPESKTIGRMELVDYIISMLRRKEPVGGNTGRSLVFAERRVLDVIRTRARDAGLLHDFYLIGDKGGVWLQHDTDGRPERFLDEALRTEEVERLLRNVQDLVQREYAHVMFVDTTKQTMVTIEMNDGTRIVEFQPLQEEVVERLLRLVKAHGLEQQFRVDPTRIAIDIEWNRAGKALGAQRFLTMLHDRGVWPKKFVTFGDSRSDIAMAEELHRLGHQVEFVFVGGVDDLSGRTQDRFPVTFTQRRYDEGTLEYLTSTSGEFS